MKTRISNLKYAAAPLALGLALISTPSFAQDAAAEEETAEAIVVTGSLITNPNLERSAPVNVTSAEEMELLQSNLAEEVLREIPGVVEKWDLYVDGFELATGYSELIDPVVQRDRLVEQAQLGAKGDLEAMQVDEDFLRAMEFGMPPMGGMGMGVDRLLMALTGLGIRETILFPLVKPEVE